MTGSPPEKSKVPLYDIIFHHTAGALEQAGNLELRGHLLHIPETPSRTFFLPKHVGTWSQSTSPHHCNLT